MQGAQDKEAIVENLAGSRKALYNTPRGSAVLRACGVDAYLRSPAEWRQSAASAAAAREQFARLFGDAPHQTAGNGAAVSDGGAPHVEASKGHGNKKQKRPATAEAASGGGSAAVAVQDNAEKPRQKRKKPETAVEAPAEPLGGQQTEHIMDLLGEGVETSVYALI